MPKYEHGISFTTKRKTTLREIKQMLKATFGNYEDNGIFINEVADNVEINYRNRWDC